MSLLISDLSCGVESKIFGSKTWMPAELKRPIPASGEPGGVSAVPDQAPDRFRLVVQVDHGLLHAMTGQVLEGMGDERAIDQRQGRLGPLFGQRPHPFAETGGQDHRLHDAIAPYVGGATCLESRSGRACGKLGYGELR